MSALREMQETFAAAVFGDGLARQRLLNHFVHPANRGAEQGLDAYQASIRANLAAALTATYPLVQAIVGPDFFAAAARAYAMQVPSRSGDLNDYGDEFDRFLAAYAPAATLAYLPDVARLEWCIQQVHTAPAAPGQDLAALADIDGAHWGGLCFRLDPGHRLLASAWPLARIWAVNQPGYEGDFTVDFAQGQSVLVQRQAEGVRVIALTTSEYRFLEVLGQGRALAEAVAVALEHDPDFDLGAVLHTHLGSGLIHGIAGLPPLCEVSP